MNYIPVVDQKLIEKHHKTFSRRLDEYVSEKYNVFIGHMGKDTKNTDTIKYSEQLDIWWINTKIFNRYWNAFGIGRPQNNRNVSIVCELNYPLAGLDLKIAGLYVTSGEKTVLVHSGKIGGGKPGVGKNLFKNNYVNEYISIEANKKKYDFAVVGSLDSPRLGEQISLFVKEIDRIKRMATGSTPSDCEPNINTLFSEEYFGTKTVKRVINSEIICDHGLVVNSLREILTSQGLKTANDRNRDLYILEKNNRISTLFEIKTDLDSQSLYTAVGQLLINSINLPAIPKKILVVPEGLDAAIKLSLEKLGIRSISYRWRDNNPIFSDLELMIY